MKPTLAIGAILAIGLFVVLHTTRPEPLPFNSDCEAPSSGLIRQPSNAASALLIVASGAVILTRGRDRNSDLFGGALLLTGIGSSLFHATFHPVASGLDLIGALSAVATGILLLWRRSVPRSSMVLIAMPLVIGLVVWNMSRTGGSLCAPQAPVQGHALWHALAAGAALVAAHKSSPQHPVRNTLGP